MNMSKHLKKLKLLFPCFGLFIGIAWPQSPIVEIEGDTKIDGYLDIYNNPDSSSIFVGIGAGIPKGLGSTNKNTILGFEGGHINATGPIKGFFGGFNTLIGYRSGDQIGIHSYNTLIGSQSGSATGLGSYNTFIGFRTGEDYEGDYSTVIGNHAGSNIAKTDNVFIINNKSGNAPLISADFINDKVGINYNGSQPDMFLVEAVNNSNALRVRVGGQTKFRVYANGGTSIGVSKTPDEANGLLVHHLSDAFGGRVHVDASGVLQRSRGLMWHNVPGCDFRGAYWNGLGYNMDPLKVSFAQAGEVEVFAPILLKHKAVVKEVIIRFLDNFFDGSATIKLRKTYYDSSIEETLLLDTDQTSNSFTTIQSATVPVDFVMDAKSFHLDLVVNKESTGDGGTKGFELYNIKIGYEY